MRSILFVTLLIIFGFGFINADRNHLPQKENKLNGIWVPVSEEIGGISLPKSSFETQHLVINDSIYTFTAESIDKGIVKYEGNKMDIFGKEGVNNGKHFTAIFKSNGEQLTICYNLAGTGYPESFSTKGKPLYFLCVFVKADSN